MIKDRVIVKYNDLVVGRLGYTSERKVAFQYDETWLTSGFSINPFKLPLSKEVFISKSTYFEGLFGVFADSLPDSWGRLLLERYLENKSIDVHNLGVLDRLLIVGKSSMGALTYEPAYKIGKIDTILDLDELSIECKNILYSHKCNKIDEIFKLGGSSGGARPKVFLDIDKEPWIIKFSNHIDMNNSGVMEYDYLECAKECGINVPVCRLFYSELCDGYFGVKRFDRNIDERLHVVTVAGLLEVDYRAPCLDYNELIKLTKILTRDVDQYEMFKLMCFNVFAHNLDDHAKNFSFIYYPNKKIWRLSPAYDLTYSSTYYGEHTTSVNGKGKDITDDDLLKVAINNKLDREICLKIIKHIRECVSLRLQKYIK